MLSLQLFASYLTNSIHLPRDTGASFCTSTPGLLDGSSSIFS